MMSDQTPMTRTSEASLVKLYIELTGVGESAARAVVMYVASSSSIETAPIDVSAQSGKRPPDSSAT